MCLLIDINNSKKKILASLDSLLVDGSFNVGVLQHTQKAFDINKLFGIPHCPNPADLEDSTST